MVGLSFGVSTGAGLDSVYSNAITISDRTAESRKWATQGQQPNYIHLSMNSAISGSWRVGRWQNLVSKGEMMRVMTDYRRMRFGLGVTLMTDSYFAMDIGGGWYGVPSYYTEYGAELGQALADPIRVFVSGKEEVWTRQFEHGFAIVSSLTASNFTLKVAKGLKPLPLSSTPDRLSDRREAPAWQLFIDNDLAPAPPALENKWGVASAFSTACVCSAAAPACCPKAAGTPLDWWADEGRRAGFRIVQGNWTTVTDAEQSHQVRAAHVLLTSRRSLAFAHLLFAPVPYMDSLSLGTRPLVQVGNSFAVSWIDPGPLPQGAPPTMEAAFHFVSPSTDTFNFAMTAVDAHFCKSRPIHNGVMLRAIADANVLTGGCVRLQTR